MSFEANESENPLQGTVPVSCASCSHPEARAELRKALWEATREQTHVDQIVEALHREGFRKCRCDGRADNPDQIIRELRSFILGNAKHLPEAKQKLILDYMRRKGIQGSPLRQGDAAAGVTAAEEADPMRELVRASKALLPYLDWTLGKEAPGHHPTLPSAVEQFRLALNNATEVSS